MRAALRLALVLLAFSANHARTQDAPRAGEFAWRASIGVPAGAPAAQLTLPADAMLQLRSAARHDVRVFNTDGEAVAMALIAPARSGAGPEVARTKRYTAFPLFESTGDQRPDKGSIQVRMDSAGNSSVWVHLGDAGDAARKPTATARQLPSALFDTRSDTQAISSLTLEADLPANAIVNFSLASSADLARWTPVSVKGPLFRFDGSDAFHNQTLEFGQPLQLEGRYLRLSWDVSAGIRVASATGNVTPAETAPISVNTPLAAGVAEGNTSLTWQLDFATPLAALQLSTARANTLVPVRILGRNDSAQPWRQLARGVVYRMGPPGQENTSPAIPLHGAAVRWLRVEASHGMSLAGTALQASAQFAPVRLVFLTSGKAPFELAVGRAQTPAATVDPSMLRAGVSGRLEDLPQATLAPARVQDISAWHAPLMRWLPGGGEQRKIVLWLVLAAGVLALGGVAYALLRQLSGKSGEPPGHA